MSSLQTHHATYMNCSWSISYFPQSNISKNEARKLVLEAFSKVSDFENYFTIFHDSPFNNLNKYAGKKKVKLTPDAISLIKESIKYFKFTDKQFNICFQSDEGFNDPELIEINESTGTVFLPHKEMKISLGGIGKGYAVDIAYDYLKNKGMINFMVNGSGDLRVHSHMNSPRPWKIGITNPFNIKNNIGIINLRQGSIATSGQYLKEAHIKSKFIDTPLAVTIQSDRTVYSDVMATYISGLDIKLAAQAMEDLKLTGFIIDRNGQVLRSTNSFKEL